MTDIFVRTRTNNPIRLALAEACLRRLGLFEEAKLHLICARGFPLPDLRDEPLRFLCHEALPDSYHVGSRKIAQLRAISEVYVVIDDDCMPIGRDWLAYGLVVMARFPEFAALASWSINGEIIEKKCALPPPHPITYSVDEIFEVESLGTPTFIRRFRPTGEMLPLTIPEGDLGQYDATLSGAYRQHGRIGMLRHVRHNHLGYGLSEVVPEWWLA